MKFLISAILLFFALTQINCKKNPTTPSNYFMTMKIDNKDYSFNDSLVATKQSGQPVLQIFASGKTNGQLQLLFSDFTTGTYIVTNDVTVQKVIYQFTINAIVGYTNNVPIIQMLLRPNPTVANPISLTITNSTNIYVEGTFNGILSNGASSSTITNGQFKIPFK